MVTKTCRWCNRDYDTDRSRTTFCSDACREEQIKARDRRYYERRVKAARSSPAPRPCGVCGTSFVSPLPHRRYCSSACQSRANGNFKIARRAQEKAGRACQNCGGSMDGRRSDAKRCAACAKRGQSKPPKAARATKRSEGRPKRERVRKEKPRDMSKPNLSGDWFPGWSGRYPSHYSEEDIARIERGRQLLVEDDVMRHRDREGRVYRYGNFGGRSDYPDEQAS